jgi:acetyl-CoA carboxylase carboxyl transferase subunit alpha
MQHGTGCFFKVSFNNRVECMKITYLDFEQPIAELEAKIESLRTSHDDHDNLDISKELDALEKKNKKLSADIYGNLSAWQISQLARHPQRPYTLDYIQALFTDFEELHGDRAFADDPAIVGGIARFEGQPVMVIGHQKGRDIKERQYRNFGMPRPEGYRKALRLYRLAEKFHIPVVTLIDTPGAYPGIGAEERGQSEAIARNLYVMAELKTPIVGVIIGEGGSGGALALGVVDQLLMLQYGTYSVISPEGCASILYKSADKASVAAESLAITADRLKAMGLVDKIVPEPLGGAHRSPEVMMETLRGALKEELTRLKAKSIKSLLVTRYERLMSYGKFKEAAEK